LEEDVPACEAVRRARRLNLQDAWSANLLYTALFNLGRKTQSAHQYSEALCYFSEAAAERDQVDRLKLTSP